MVTAAGLVSAEVATAAWYAISTSGDLPPEERDGDQPFTSRPRASYSLRMTRPLASVTVSVNSSSLLAQAGSVYLYVVWTGLPWEVTLSVSVTESTTYLLNQDFAGVFSSPSGDQRTG